MNRPRAGNAKVLFRVWLYGSQRATGRAIAPWQCRSCWLRILADAEAAFKLVVESGGAVALAAVLSGKYAIKGRKVAVAASGGNVNRETFSQALAEA
jgi:hypothetical protein